MRLFTINEKIYHQLKYLRKHKILTTVNKHYLPLLNISTRLTAAAVQKTNQIKDEGLFEAWLIYG